MPGLTIQARLGTIVTAHGTDQSVRALLEDSAVMSIEQSRPVGALECDRSLPFIRAAAQYAGPTGPYAEAGECALVAVIDNGIDVLHQAFLDAAGHSRIVGIWDQTDPTGPPPTGFGYGTFYDASSLNAAISSQVAPGRLGRNDHGHGTHVASIAAGRAAGEFTGGVAPDARLLVVVSAGSGPIGYSKCHIEALVFIDGMAPVLNLPVVVNLSQGMNAGAHDGKSALEVAFDAFSSSGRAPGRIVVKSAGNERGQGGHAKVTLPTGAQEDLRWARVQGADATERIELWWSSADDIQFRLRGPAGKWTSVVKQASLEAVGKFVSDGPYRLTMTSRHVDNGDKLLLIELGDATTSAGVGEWRLELTSDQASDGGVVHAWIERSQGVPTTFMDHLDQEMTLRIPATAASVIAVGAVDASTPVRVAKFSSYGPTRDGQYKPQVCAPGVKVRAAEGGTDDGVYAESGTSMAAPHVTGAIALLLSRGAKSGRIPGANQVAAALRQKAQNTTGRFDRGQGFGVVDVSALLAAF